MTTSNIKNSAGLLIVKNNKILLCHPTNASWTGTYSIPKGHIENNETKIEAAIRETREEVGILVPIEFIDKTEHVIEYTDKSGKVFKRVFFFVAHLDGIEDVIPKEQLQIEEVDWAGFLDIEQANMKIFWRFKPLLNFLNHNKNII
ncbi:MAG: NUDIX hydrolase [Ignavibacteria bacterium]|nr:NUDIX hydrolase [Ignavibacteria bacterium]